MYDVGLGEVESGEEEGRNSLEMVQEKLEAYLCFKKQHLYLLMTFQFFFFFQCLAVFKAFHVSFFTGPHHIRDGGGGGWNDPSPSKLIPGRPRDLNLRLLPG